MSLSDLLASTGVTLLLIAFVLNIRKVLPAESKWYSLLNIAGAALCGYSAYLINFYPFVILETAWVIAAISTLIRRVPRETLPVMSKFVNLNCSTWNIDKKCLKNTI